MLDVAIIKQAGPPRSEADIASWPISCQPSRLGSSGPRSSRTSPSGDPVVSRICAQEGLACDSVEAGYPGTNAVFLVDRRYAVKVYNPFWKDFGVEKELHIALGHEARVPVPQMVASGRFVDRIDWGYLITEFLEGEPVRELRGALSRDDLIAIAADLGRMVRVLRDGPRKPESTEGHRWTA